MQFKNPLITVIVPSYNYAHYLPFTLDSVLQQTYINWECIIVDDGSTDNTGEVAESYSKRDQRFKYFYQENKGLSGARNAGLQMANGEYIQLLDADDLIGSDKFMDQINMFRVHPSIDIVYSNYQLMSADGLTKSNPKSTNWIEMKRQPIIEFLFYWEKGFTIPIHSYLFKKQCFDKWGGFNVNLPTHEDLALQLNFSANGASYKMHNVVNNFYRIHLTSVTKDMTQMHKGYLVALYDFYRDSQMRLSLRLIAIHRYFQEYLNTLLDSLRGKKNNFLTAINIRDALFLNIVAFLVSPLYLIIKIIERLVR